MQVKVGDYDKFLYSLIQQHILIMCLYFYLLVEISNLSGAIQVVHKCNISFTVLLIIMCTFFNKVSMLIQEKPKK